LGRKRGRKESCREGKRVVLRRGEKPSGLTFGKGAEKKEHAAGGDPGK